jgi:hypothetical protein
MRGKGKIGRQVLIFSYLDKSKDNLNGQAKAKRADSANQ